MKTFKQFLEEAKKHKGFQGCKEAEKRKSKPTRNREFQPTG
jgi:hypothetical protein